MQPAFNAKTYDLVWTETTKIYQDMVKTENWPTSPGERVSLESFNKLTYKLGLYVIIACGFGLPFRWAEPPKSTEGSKSVQDNIVTVEKWALLLIMTPKWLFKLPFKKLQNIYEEYESIKSFIREEVAIRRSKIREAVDMGEVDREAAVQFDVFSRLVLANETADSKSGLSDEELIGNTFALLFAGHDTTASTVAAVVALLALHPSEQRKVHEEVMNVLREDGALTLSSYSKLTYTLYCFLEASRMFPAGHVAIRTCLEDTVIDIPSTKETASPTRLVLPKNSEVIVDMVGLHMQGLPYVVVNEEHVLQVYNLYWTAFDKLRNYPRIHNMQDNERFCEFLREILNEHAAAIPTLSLGLSICSPHLESDELDSFMRRMLISRISRRVLAEHHLALTEDLANKETSVDSQDANVGIIFTKLNVKRCFDKFIRLLSSDGTLTDRLRRDSLLQGTDKLPEIIVDGDLNTSFSYIREHLEYVILELLLNALRATAIQMKESSFSIPGVIRATISSDEDDVYIRISDQGGGLMLTETQTPADLYSFSHHRNTTRMRDDRLVALQHFSQRKGGLWGKVQERIATPGSEDQVNEDSKDEDKPQPMGMGLPLSNIHVTYFGGTLELLSMDGWGTDVYVRLPRLGTNLEGIEV
ncbi:hypothetical protein FRB91_010277 [Serendipita sp. 411]|nr:hypothetical protein FRB91_010277 [Serendipita sp. 411]